MKDTFYFSHDSDAREDPKIVAMRSVYGWEGYGWYWLFVEIMRSQQDYCLDITGKYVFNAFALQMHCPEERAQQFIMDCIDEFKLFKSDGEKFWSESLIRRMEEKELRSKKARDSARVRWNKPEDANAMQTQCDSNAIKESKEKENNTPPTPPKQKFLDYVYLSEDEYNRLVTRYGMADVTRMIEILDIYIGQNPKKNNRYTDHNRVLRGWVRERFEDEQQKKTRASPAHQSEIPL